MTFNGASFASVWAPNLVSIIEVSDQRGRVTQHNTLAHFVVWPNEKDILEEFAKLDTITMQNFLVTSTMITKLVKPRVVVMGVDKNKRVDDGPYDKGFGVQRFGIASRDLFVFAIIEQEGMDDSLRSRNIVG